MAMRDLDRTRLQLHIIIIITYNLLLSFIFYMIISILLDHYTIFIKKCQAFLNFCALISLLFILVAFDLFFCYFVYPSTLHYYFYLKFRADILYDFFSSCCSL